ncbi:tetratricopeptide repeat protein [Aestuariirhabdus sp. Z084]|uniref:tetratricopeptide repeat protein n=1 Tax=Aestuariirhabdus haliotis TaxID=2918751 RepID=UPI00201B4487|nr:tetratricopeptide repeat protein [Aestuariirhabdus haliotis]MCL6415276.1 tetratricopeptide repeat protein [Aestuariirhabdus haliotis]MCL6419536.1 tetratricopeptide repeat protein [Aestuariirhabdus haliotis]
MSRILKALILLSIVLVSLGYHFRGSIAASWYERSGSETANEQLIDQVEQYLSSWGETLNDERFYHKLKILSEQYWVSWHGMFETERLIPEHSISGQQYLQMLLDKQYERLTEALEPHLVPSNEEQSVEMQYALNALDRDEVWLQSYFDEWVEATPTKAVPYLARADYLLTQGLLARGTDYIRNTPEYNLVKMRMLFELSMKDLNKVKSINDQTAYPYAIQLNIAMRQGSAVSKRSIYEQGVKRDPELNWIYSTYLSTLAPKWGGSAQQEKQFIEELRSKYQTYPWLKSNEVSWMIDQVDALPGKACDKIAEYQRAYDFYTNSWSSYNLGRAYSCDLQFDEALGYLRESVERWPYQAIAWRLIGAIQHKLGDSESALESTRIAAHLDPSDDFSFFQLGNISLYLERYERAIVAYNKAIKANPEKSDYSQYLELAENFLANPGSPHDLYLLKDSWGGMVSKTTYVKGRKEGKAIIYDDHNNPKEYRLYENDVFTKLTRLHPDGSVSTVLSIKGDKIDGPYQEISVSGNVISTGVLDAGLPEGDMNVFFENGQSLLTNHYQKGKKLTPTKFNVPAQNLNGVTGVSIASGAMSHIGSPLNQTSKFSFDGDPIFIYTALDGIQGQDNKLNVEFFDAAGNRAFEYLTVLQNSGDGFNFSSVYYTPDPAKDQPGEWTVTASLNSELFDSYTISVNDR